VAASSSTNADDDVAEELEVILGYPSIMAPRSVSLDEVVGTAHWALTQVQGVLCHERRSIIEEHQCLLFWASLLREQTASERARRVVRQEHLNEWEELLNMQLAAISRRDADSQKMLADAKELYSSAEARANTVIKQEEDLTVRVCVVAEREKMVVELEEKL
jgi:uncharacterized protein (DUF3084 family)